MKKLLLGPTQWESTMGYEDNTTAHKLTALAIAALFTGVTGAFGPGKTPTSTQMSYLWGVVRSSDCSNTGARQNERRD